MPRVLPELQLSAEGTYIFTPETLKKYLEVYKEHNSYEWALDALIEVARCLNAGFPEAALQNVRNVLHKYAGKESW